MRTGTSRKYYQPSSVRPVHFRHTKQQRNDNRYICDDTAIYLTNDNPTVNSLKLAFQYHQRMATKMENKGERIQIVTNEIHGEATAPQFISHHVEIPQ